MFKKTSRDYAVLIPALVVFYVVMTLDTEKLQHLVAVEMVRLMAGVVAAAILLWYNLKHYRKMKKGGQ